MKFALTFCLLAALTANAGTFTGRVVGITDGDTVTVLDSDNVQHKVRLSGIDAPEKKQDFGNRSKESLSELVFSKLVSVETGKQDRYGREVGKIVVDGVDANLRQVQRGFAWHYKAYMREQSLEDKMLYSDAEDDAKAEKLGLWRDKDPIAPWAWRKGKRQNGG
jgi:endonuclease YncB( thermonuclease family)